MAGMTKTPIGKFYMGMMRGSYRLWRVISKIYEDGVCVGSSACHTDDYFWDMDSAYVKMCQLNGWKVKNHPEIEPIEQQPYYVAKIKRINPKNNKERTIYLYGHDEQSAKSSAEQYGWKEGDEITFKVYS